MAKKFNVYICCRFVVGLQLGSFRFQPTWHRIFVYDLDLYPYWVRRNHRA